MINLDSSSAQDRLRAKELTVLLTVANYSSDLISLSRLQFAVEGNCLQWEEEFKQLFGETDVQAWLDAQDSRYVNSLQFQPMIPSQDDSRHFQGSWENTASISSPKLLDLIEQYQKARPVVYETNFSDTPYLLCFA